MKLKKEPTREQWTDVVGIAKHLKISKETVYRLIKAKKIPKHRIGRLWRFNKGEIDQWIMKK